MSTPTQPALTYEQFDKVYRDVWSSFPSSNRLWRFAEAIYALAPQQAGGEANALATIKAVTNVMQAANAERAAAVQPDPAYGYASHLAQGIFQKHYSSDPHYASGEVKWEVCPDTLGVLTQIDNMVAGMTRAAAVQPMPIAQVSEIDGKKCVTFYSYKALYETPLWTPLYARAAAEAWVRPRLQLERWGRGTDPKLLLERMEDGYWTPWHIAQAAVDVSAAAAEPSDDAKAAERYRWLRDNYTPPGDMHQDFDDMDKAVAVGGRMLDAAIDAAISASRKPQAEGEA